MVAARVIDSHLELDDIGSLTHAQLDTHVSATFFVVVSGSVEVPPNARRLVSGTGVTIVDGGPGSTLTISAAGNITNITWNETPTGLIDGSNTVFVFAAAPNPTGAIMLFLNGVKQRQGIGSDFVLSGSTVTFDASNVPRAGANIEATYQY